MYIHTCAYIHVIYMHSVRLFGVEVLQKLRFAIQDGCKLMSFFCLYLSRRLRRFQGCISYFKQACTATLAGMFFSGNEGLEVFQKHGYAISLRNASLGLGILNHEWNFAFVISAALGIPSRCDAFL